RSASAPAWPPRAARRNSARTTCWWSRCRPDVTTRCSGRPPGPSASRSATCGRAAPRWRRCSSARWGHGNGTNEEARRGREPPERSICFKRFPPGAHAPRLALTGTGDSAMPIFDQGYQHWQGSLSGHGWRWLAVVRHGVRTGMQNRWLRLTLLFAWIPSLVLAAFLCLWGMAEQKKDWAIGLLAFFLPSPELLRDPAAFRLPVWALAFHVFLQVEMYFVMILVLMVGPGLISQ